MSEFLEFVSNRTFPDFVFFVLCALILGCGAVVVFSKNIVHSAFALLGTFSGVAGLYGLAASNFVAAVQILVYVGGVLILILFAVMLTQDIQNVEKSNPRSNLLPALFAGVLAAGALIAIAVCYPWNVRPAAEVSSTVPQIGDQFLTRYLLPFELLSMALLTALIGSVMLVRKEIKEEKSRRE